MKKIIILVSSLGIIVSSAFAFMPKETAMYFNGPTVSAVTDTSATVSLSPQVLSGITEEEKSGMYFEYYETNKVCIAIYPTPAECLPKKTAVGATNTILANLKPATSYTVRYKRDNTIRCITAPCPTNDFESLSVTFVTTGTTATNPPSGSTGGVTGVITRNLGLGSSGAQVRLLQEILVNKGYMKIPPTGFFGRTTFQAVKAFQRDNKITPTGYVGIATKRALMANGTTSSSAVSPDEEKFEGTITAYSTGCFSDGICSVTVDGKTIVTTIGWSQAIVGKVTGIPDFGSIESSVGKKAKVYAKKTTDGYTLYGSAAYYIEVGK